MAAYPSYADYLEEPEYDGTGPSGRRARRVKRAPNVPMPGPPVPAADPNTGPPDPFAPRTAPVPSAAPSASLPNPTFDRAYNMEADAATGPPTPQFPPGPGINPKVGIPTAGLNKTGRRLAEIEAMRKFDPASKISRETDWGYEVDPPERSPSRFKQALMGALQGALAGAEKTGTLGGMLGGAGTGAAAGGINPRLMLALKRDQDIRRAQGQLTDDLKIEGIQTKIEGEQADTDYQRARPSIEMAEVIRRRQGDIDTLEQRKAEDATRLSIEAMRDARAKLGNQTTIEAARIRAGNSGSGAIAAEGEEEAAQADAAAPGVRAAMDKWSADNAADVQWMKGLEREWNAQATAQYQQALQDYNPDFDLRPSMDAILDQIRRADTRFPDYERTKANVEQRTKDIEKESTKLKEIEKEGRSGRGKAARGKKGASNANTHGFSISAYMKANPGTTEEDAKAFAADNYPSYRVIP